MSAYHDENEPGTCVICGRPTIPFSWRAGSWRHYHCSEACRRISVQRHRDWIRELNARSMGEPIPASKSKPIQMELFGEDEVSK